MVQRADAVREERSVSIAYQVVGDGPTDMILVPGFVSHVEVAWEEPRLAQFLARLAAFSRLIMFDKRGTGMSDPVASPPSMDQRMDDIRAVMDAAGSAGATVFGVSEGGTLSLLFAHAHPERAEALILYGSWARRLAGPGLPVRPLRGAAGGHHRRDGPGVGYRRMVGRRSAERRPTTTATAAGGRVTCGWQRARPWRRTSSA